jgi:catalase-peroxidase
MKLYSSSAAGLALLLFATPAFAQKTPKAYDDPAQKATADRPLKNKDWWPNQLNLKILAQNSKRVDPMHGEFDYAAEFKKLDLAALKKDLEELMTDSQDWWPADWGHYGPLFIRMAWHSAGTYRVGDGRGGASDGTQRFAPLNSWPDNANLDKARRLLWPVKQKYGQKISWADLMILAGNVALESMGFETFGFGGGRADVWEPQEDIYWGPEGQWLADQRYSGDRELMKPLAAVQMGLIYVNPEGPNGNPDPLLAAKDIRETFGRMAMNDEETVALIAGGHSFGKAHGAGKASNVGPDPEAAPLEEQGLGWKNKYKSGKGADTITSGLEGAWTITPTKWSHNYFGNLFGFEWKLTKSPAGAWQWTPVDMPAIVPDAHIKGKMNKVMMFTTDIALIRDPAYRKISERFHKNPKEFEKAFAKAWYKLTHRDMGPVTRLHGPEVAPAQIWQDPVPAVDHDLVDSEQIEKLKDMIRESGLSAQEMVATAWASAASFRDSDKRGGANGARIRLAPMNSWEANNPAQLQKVLAALGKIQEQFNATAGATKISMADLIVLAGAAGIEHAAKMAGHDVKVPFTPGRSDATEDMTDAASFAVLEPKADGFCNYFTVGNYMRPESALVDRANQLTLTAPEMTVLVGGLRSIGVTAPGTQHGLLGNEVGQLDNSWFVNLLDMGVEWKKVSGSEYEFVAHDRKSGDQKWTASAVDLIFGSNAQLRSVCEVYASSDAKQKFVNDFVAAWHKVMMLDRFEIHGN